VQQDTFRGAGAGHGMSAYGVPEDPSRLVLLQHGEDACTSEAIVEALEHDQVALIRNMCLGDADAIVARVAESFGLRDQLELQAACASLRGHRTNIGAYFMSVNERSDYRFIPSHSEGRRSADMQLASLYCIENTTDGGVTILQHADDASAAWDVLREVVTKIGPGGRPLSPDEIVRAKMMYEIFPDDVLCDDDTVLGERQSPFPDITCFTVLAKLKKTYSRILGRDVNVYWDNIASPDRDSGTEYLRLLRHLELLREPTADADVSRLDHTQPRKVWSSGVRYEELFTSRIALKLSSGDLLIQNNLTWTHSSTNWTPGSGERKVAAAFA
jgi:hypothetical protein